MTNEGGRITWLGHSTVVIELDGVRLLTDPLLRTRAAHLRRVVPPVLELSRVDSVLVSHAHWDHLDLRSLELLGRDVPVVIPLGAARLLRRRGFSNVTEVEEGEHVDVGAVVVRATHAEHSPGRGPIGVRSPALGYVVEGTRSVYFAGDTDRFDGMAQLAPSLDVALLPVAGWGARIPAGHLDAVAAAETLTLLRPRIAIPVHWGTFAPFYRGTPHNPDAGLRFAEHARRVAPDVEVRVLRPGESSPI